jgi:large subunit ribosomal protein L24
MQRVIQRAIRVEKHAARRADKIKAAKDVYDFRAMQQELITSRRSQRSMEKNARIEHREDWFLGPLAPRRDVGVPKRDLGVVPEDSIRQSKVGKLALKEIMKKARRGESRNVFMAKDRVVIIRGQGLGLIGAVSSINWKEQTALLKEDVLVSSC